MNFDEVMYMDNSINEILNALGNISDKHAVVIGDILLDEYIYGMVNKVSTGIQIPIIDKESVEYRLGGSQCCSQCCGIMQSYNINWTMRKG